MWLPDSVYKALPFVYLTAGISAMFFADHIIGYGACLLLVFAGLLILKLRKDNSAPIVKGDRRRVARVRSSATRKGANRSARPERKPYRTRVMS
jgi:hypothetical protein